MKYISKKLSGGMTAEAAIVFPVVVMVILPFLYLFQMLLVQSWLEDTLDRCLRQMATEVYVLERLAMLPEEISEDTSSFEDGQMRELDQLLEQYSWLLDEEAIQDRLEAAGINLAGQWLLKNRMEDWLAEEDLAQWGVENGWQGISALKSEFFVTREEHQHLLCAQLTFDWAFPIRFWKSGQAQIRRVYHAFIGEEGNSGYEEEIQEPSDQIVYRIGQGIRYHRLSCYLIRKTVMATTVYQAQQAGLQPCQRCHPEKAVTVYRTDGGEHYHLQSCTYLYPNLTAITLEEALQAGYTECELCRKGGL